MLSAVFQNPKIMPSGTTSKQKKKTLENYGVGWVEPKYGRNSGDRWVSLPSFGYWIRRNQTFLGPLMGSLTPFNPTYAE
jgi:hypothetical protein